LNLFRTRNEWRPFVHVAIDHQPLTAFEQWKTSRHRLLWVVGGQSQRGPTVECKRAARWSLGARVFLHWSLTLAMRCLRVAIACSNSAIFSN